MRIKNILLILLIIPFLTGCNLTVKNINNRDIMENVDIILNNTIKYTNKDAIGYQYYLPNNMNVKSSNEFNEVLISSNVKYYLYADIVSYHYNTKVNYKVNNNSYMSKKLNYNNKKGYLEINEDNGKYYIEMMYNYAKIEALTNKNKINECVSNMSYILSSIKYNDNVIDTLIGNKKYDLSDSQTYNIFETKKNKNNFLDYVNEYDNYDGDVESLIEKEEIQKDEE